MEIMEFLDHLENSRDYKTTNKIVDDFLKKPYKLNFTVCEKLINISAGNSQVLGTLKSWENKKYVDSTKRSIIKRRNLFSESVDLLLKNTDKLGEKTLVSLRKVHNNIYLSLLRRSNAKEEVYLYHGNSVITSLEFILNKRIFSREYAEKQNIMQTYQRSDNKDKEQGIFNDIFFDNSDIGERNICAYGPITFIFKAEKILSLEKEIKITKDNPIYIKENESMYFSGLLEISKFMDDKKNYTFCKQFNYHTTIRNCDYIEITKENLKEIIIENDKNLREDIPSENSSEKVKSIIEDALEKVNLKGVRVTIRPIEKKNSPKNYSTSIEELWAITL